MLGRTDAGGMKACGVTPTQLLRASGPESAEREWLDASDERRQRCGRSTRMRRVAGAARAAGAGAGVMTDQVEFLGRDGNRMVADVAGDPTDPPVVLLHGGGQTRHSWGT